MTACQYLPDHQSPPMSPPPMKEENDEEATAKQQEFSSDDEEEDVEKGEFVFVNLADIRNQIQCPVCLGILRKTRAFKECLHRFCGECINKSMRLGNKECPVCRTHYPSKRSLRDDLNYDALIASLYPDIDKYEEEVQANIAETMQKHAEPSGKRKRPAKATARNLKHKRKGPLPGSEEEDVDNQIDYSSADERSSKNSRAKIIPHFKAENDEMPVWGRSGARSQMRHDNPHVEVTDRLVEGGGGRISKLVGHFQSLQENDDEQFVGLQTSTNPQDIMDIGELPKEP